MTASPVPPAEASTRPQGSTIIEWPKVSRPSSCKPAWAAAIDEGAVLDRARPEQDFPMRLAGLAGEGRGQRHDLGAGQRLGAKELREAHVVADRKAQPAKGQVGDARLVRPAGRSRFRASSRHCRDRRRTCGSCRSGVTSRHPARTASRDWRPCRRRAGSRSSRHGRGCRVRAASADARAATTDRFLSGRRIATSPCGRAAARRSFRASGHRQRRQHAPRAPAFPCWRRCGSGSMPEHIWMAATLTMVMPPAAGSSLPARSSAWMSSQPPTCLPSMKICGKVVRPCALSIISARSSGLAGGVMLDIVDALLLQQCLGRRAVAAILPRIDHDRCHVLSPIRG